jgi:hypothetical protein
VPADLRATWRLPVLLLIVEKCWGGRAGWAQMHALSWMLLTGLTSDEASRILAGDIGLGEEVVGIDPAVNLAIDRAVGEGLLRPDGSRVRLTEAGVMALKKIKQSGGFEAEQATLDALQGKVSENRAKRAFGVRT